MSTGYCDYRWQEGEAWSNKYVAPTVEAMLGSSEGRTVLDLGCGHGVLACGLIERGFDVYGIDVSETGVAAANARYPGRFFVHDVNSASLPAPLAGIAFNTIVSTEVIEHLYAPRTYMRLVRSILQRVPEGELVLSTPYHGYLKNLALAVSGRLDGHFTALWDGGHIKFWSRRTLTTLFGEFGLEVVEFRGAGRLPWLWKSMVIRARLPVRSG